MTRPCRTVSRSREWSPETVPIPERLDIPISAIEHWSYCPRQCALIRVERVFEDNGMTLQGSHQHARVDMPMLRVEDGMRVERALPLWSERLGITGRADVVEFDGDVIRPVEYKRGARGARRHELLQVCAQALCLEEMFGTRIEQAAVYYQAAHRRDAVCLSNVLRCETEQAIESCRETLCSDMMPPAVLDARCRDCSLARVCDIAILRLADALAEANLFDCTDDLPWQEEGQ